jgi:MFS family permease
VGPVDAAIRISITAFACALPLNLAGMLLLRLVKDAKEIGLDDLTLQAFQDAGFPQIEAYFPASPDRDLQRKRRSNLTLIYCLGIVILSGALTIAGLMAALWHMAWWIAAALGAAILFSAVLVVGVFAQFVQPESEAEKELKRRYVEEQLKKKERH